MKTKTKGLTIVFTCLMMSLVFPAAFVQGADNRPTISDAERALAWTQVQNTMSKHMHYHNTGDHEGELNDIWVSKDSPYYKTIRWSNPDGIWEGNDFITYYVTANTENRWKSLKALNKIYPEIEVIPENLGVGTLVIHTQTTPIIEIAGDGKTAKGIWYSPGISINAEVINNQEENVGLWYWEKYAVDFIKEGNEWKIWHLQTYYDLTPLMGSDWTESRPRGGFQSEQPAESSGEEQAMPERQEPTRQNSNSYKRWSPTTVPVIMPRFPEPYYTFSETFSY